MAVITFKWAVLEVIEASKRVGLKRAGDRMDLGK